MNMMQQETGDQKDVEIPTDYEEVTIPPHDRINEVPDFPDINLRDEQTLLNTQREDWLQSMKPLHGARPRQTGRERPPVIENRLPMEATGGAASRKPGRAPLLSPGRQISMEEEVITLQRGDRPAPEPQGPPCGVRAVPNPFPSDFPEDSLRDGDLDRQDIGSPVDMLVNTVARMQKDIATLRDPGGGTVSTVSPRWMTFDDVFQPVEQSGGTSVGSLRGFDSVDRRDSGWGHSWTGVSS